MSEKPEVMGETTEVRSQKSEEGAGDVRSETKGMTGGKYWRSLEELEGKPEFREFVEREFPKQASEWVGDGESRRTFMKIMGASAALAGLASCRRWPAEELAPYAHRPANRMDGVPVHYATATELCGMGMGVVAVSFDGRPIKVDGTAGHPLNMGKADTYLLASVLNVYDPERSRDISFKGTNGRDRRTWQEFGTFIAGKVKAGGAGVVVLSEATRSPTVARLRKALSGAKFFEWEAFGADNARAGAMAVFGRPLRAVPRLADADVIVSLDADLFAGDAMSIKYNRDFAAGRMLRDADKFAAAKMNRLYVVESGFTITGSTADHRKAVKPSEVAGIASAIRAALSGGAATDEFVKAVVADVKAAGKRAVFVAGARQSAEVHAAAAAINAAIGAPVDYYAEPEDPRAEAGWTGGADQLKAFVAAAAGAELVVVLGANPVLTAPKDVDVAGVLGMRPSVHVGLYEDETAKTCMWHVPEAHYLEAWGDVRTFDGTVSITQPLIEPLFGGKSKAEILALLANPASAATTSAPATGPGAAVVKGRDLVMETAKGDYLAGRFTEWAWKQALFAGMVAGSGRKPETVTAPADAAGAVAKAAATRPAGSGYELVVFAGAVHDGRYVNNGWLQELPDPMTRVSWDNPVAMSVADSEKLGVESDDIVTLTANGTTIRGTVYVLPGQPQGVLGMAAGYGRKGIGTISEGIGENVYPLVTSRDVGYVGGVAVGKTTEVNPLACVQQHHLVDLAPDSVGKARMTAEIPVLVVEGTLEEYRRRPEMATRRVKSLSMFNERDYSQVQKWGMMIDLTVCTGCSACVIACQSENNIPIVGKALVYKGREMHWIRIDRYFKHDEANPQAVHQPVTCMHCENAPCEEVCPVAATTHSVEGLNMMTYNRCIGTRYCSNNCPYKVRRFNFFDYNQGEIENHYTPNILRPDISELLKMSKNPQVTVRMRGVMEKCTYCVQRIENARIKVREEHRGDGQMHIPDGAIVTACQQACPTDAIVFGDLNDMKSRVSKLASLQQVYGLLDPELNTKPRTQYLAKVRNPAAGVDADIYESGTSVSKPFFFEEEKGAEEPKERPGGTPVRGQ